MMLLAFTAGSVRQYYPTGELMMETVFDSTCNCDHVTEYFQSGKVRKTATYKKVGLVGSQIDGPIIAYFENGNIALSYTMVNGVEDGRVYSNFPNGHLGYEHFIKNGYKDSTWTQYNEDGSLQLVQQFIPSRTRWDSDLDFATTTYYFADKPTYAETLEGGKRTRLKIVDKARYTKLQATLPPPGETLFRANCAMCHRTDRDVVGPKLEGVVQRRNHDWLKKMIANGDALKQSGDASATKLYEDWMQTQHPDFTRLEDAEVEEIIAYLAKFK